MDKTVDGNFSDCSSIKILLVEDLKSDAELAELEITKGLSGWCDSVGFLRVDNREDFLQSISNYKPDIIISDYMMPHFSGMEVIDLALKFSPSTPIVILTGSMNEETAVECMKAGASDYVIKEHMARLPFAVKEAIKRKKEERLRAAAEEALEESERKFRLIAEKANDLVYRYELFPEKNSRMSALLPQRLQAIHRRSTTQIQILVSNWSILMTDGNLTGFQSK
ncbi:response regulator [Mesotoga sp.]|uniref:response regulator n=1 Tax=Mesotoga sp. TaxID=2053577 RepID=UPI00345E9CBD